MQVYACTACWIINCGESDDVKYAARNRLEMNWARLPDTVQLNLTHNPRTKHSITADAFRVSYWVSKTQICHHHSSTGRCDNFELLWIYRRPCFVRHSMISLLKFLFGKCGFNKVSLEHPGANSSNNVSKEQLHLPKRNVHNKIMNDHQSHGFHIWAF